MADIKAWFEENWTAIQTLLDEIIAFVKAIFAKEVPEADELLK